MRFQFQCPQGHVLEGDETQAGQACNCPVCGTMFLIPARPPSTPPASAFVAPAPAPGPDIRVGKDAPKPTLLHIPCPNGHELETPVEMLEQEVMCPHCQTQFKLREKNSVEYKRKRAAEAEQRERKASNAWFNWAIVIVVVVVIGLFVMMFASSR